jgi:hypothetical protein
MLTLEDFERECGDIFDSVVRGAAAHQVEQRWTMMPGWVRVR